MKKANYIIQFAIVIVGLISIQTVFADVKIKTRQTMSGQSTENTTYIKGKRERTEQNAGGIQIVNITQCDLKRSLRVMPASQVYMIDAWEQTASVAPSTTQTQTQAKTEKGGVITTTYTTKDTGEHKQMFGYMARHLIITMESESSPDACNQSKSKMQYDGWYIDATFALDCGTERYQGYAPKPTKPGCQDRYVVKQLGAGKRGYPLYEKMTMFDESGKETYSMVNEVLEISNQTLDASLFDVPADYREVKDSTQLYTSMSSVKNTNSSSNLNLGNSSSNSSVSTDSGMSSSIKNMSSKPQIAATEVGAKKAGVIHIGLANVKTGSVGEGVNAQELSAAVQNSLSEYLKTPQVEVVRLEAKLASQVDAEAQSKECDYVIYTTVSHKKGGGGGFGFGKMLGQVVSSGMGQTGSVIGNIAGQVATTAIVSAASMSGNVKSKDEISMDVKLVAAGTSTAVLSKQVKAKAKSDGEDIITPLIEQIAQAILDAAVKK